jgi:hypothetical protein
VVFSNDDWGRFCSHVRCCAKQNIGDMEFVDEPAAASTTQWHTRPYSPSFALTDYTEANRASGNGTNYNRLSALEKQAVWIDVCAFTVGHDTADALANLVSLSMVCKAAHTGARTGFDVLREVCTAKAPSVYKQCFYRVPLEEYYTADENIDMWDYILHEALITAGSEEQRLVDSRHAVSALIHMIGLRCPGWGVHEYVWWAVLFSVLHIKAPLPRHVPAVAVLCAAYDKQYGEITRTDVKSMILRLNLIGPKNPPYVAVQAV